MKKNTVCALGFLLLTFILPIRLAIGATISLEGYAYSVLNGWLVDISHEVDLYANGTKIITNGLCTKSKPCKVDFPEKATLTLCKSKGINMCQAGVRFDPKDLPTQRFAFIFSPSMNLIPYIVYRPEEMPVIDGFLSKQLESAREINESRTRLIN